MDNNAFALMFKGYSHEEFALITGLSIDFLRKNSSRIPAWRHKRWWPILFQLYLSGLLPEKQPTNGKSKEINLPVEERNKVIQHIETYIGGMIQ